MKKDNLLSLLIIILENVILLNNIVSGGFYVLDLI